MPKQRDDISNEDVLKYLESGHNITEAARNFGCCHRLIRNVRDGIRPDPEKCVDIPEEELCTSCKSRKKAPGLRYLCKRCYRTNPEGSPSHTVILGGGSGKRKKGRS